MRTQARTHTATESVGNEKNRIKGEQMRYRKRETHHWCAEPQILNISDVDLKKRLVHSAAGRMSLRRSYANIVPAVLTLYL